MATSNEDGSRKGRPQIVTIDKAFKLAEQWVSNMTKMDEEDNSTKPKFEPRPPRLGVGAVVPRESNLFDWNDPIDRKLSFKLDIGKKNAFKKADESGIVSVKHGVSSHQESDSDEDDEIESKAQAFSKKRPPNFPVSALKGSNKKHR